MPRSQPTRLSVWALGLMEPTGNGIGGDLFAIVWDPDTDRLHGRFGKLPISDVLAPAIAHAREGFPLTPVIARDWANHMTRFDQEWVEPGVVDYREVYERPPGRS